MILADKGVVQIEGNGADVAVEMISIMRTFLECTNEEVFKTCLSLAIIEEDQVKELDQELRMLEVKRTLQMNGITEDIIKEWEENGKR